MIPLVTFYGQANQELINYEQTTKELIYAISSLLDYINKCEQTIANLVPFVGAANVWAVDSFQHEEVLKTLLACLQDPAFLAYWAFNVWSQTNLSLEDIQYLGENFKDLLAPYTNQQQQLVPQVPQQGLPLQQQTIQQLPSQSRMSNPREMVQMQSQSIATPAPVSYSTGVENNPLQQVLQAMRQNGVTGLVNARKAGVI